MFNKILNVIKFVVIKPILKHYYTRYFPVYKKSIHEKN